jgi:hypothetical protein
LQGQLDGYRATFGHLLRTETFEAAIVLNEFGRLPENLSQHARGSEEYPIMHAMGGAGLIFAADSVVPK